MRKNNKGFSLIELIVVMAVLAVAIGVTSGSLSSMYHARAYQAAKTVDGIIAQSKIYALSGKKNRVFIAYNDETDKYMCLMAPLDSSGVVNGAAYETQEFGNNNLNITVNGRSIKDEGLMIMLEYNMDTGALKKLVFADPDSVDVESSLSNPGFTDVTVSDGKCEIVFDYVSTHRITIYKSTGDHIYS